MSISILFARKLAQVAKIAERLLMWVQGHSRSSNLSAIKRAYGVLAVANSNVGHISYGFGRFIGQKSPLGHVAVSLNSLAGGEPLRMCR